jgi:ribosomal protein S18 acetylase RimI-like enzyme
MYARRMEIAIATPADLTDELVAAVAHLMPQLNPTVAPPSRDQLAEIIATCDLFLVRDASSLVAMGTLATYRTPVGVHGWIEDVVVDTAARARGIGEALTRAMLARAREKQVRTLALTSNPRREAANRLYQRLGFTVWDTNLYKGTLSTSAT